MTRSTRQAACTALYERGTSRTAQCCAQLQPAVVYIQSVLQQSGSSLSSVCTRQASVQMPAGRPVLQCCVD